MIQPKKKSLLKKVEKPEKVNEEQALVATRKIQSWEAPSGSMRRSESGLMLEIRQNAQIIHDTLAEFNIEAAMGDINVGPKVTQYT